MALKNQKVGAEEGEGATGEQEEEIDIDKLIEEGEQRHREIKQMVTKQVEAQDVLDFKQEKMKTYLFQDKDFREEKIKVKEILNQQLLER